MIKNSTNNADNPQAADLEAQLVDADGFLKRSLSQEERGRRSKRRWKIAICDLLASAAVVLGLSIFINPELIASDKSAQGWSLWNQRRLPEAEAKFREALMENNQDADAWTGLGWSLTNTGRLKDAIDAFQHALEIAPDNISAQNGLGQCSLGTGNLTLAEESLKKSSEGLIKLSGGEDKINASNLPAAWYGLVNLYLLKDDFQQAKQWADRIAKITPDDETLKSMLQQIEKRDSKPTKRMFGLATDKPATDKPAADKPATAEIANAADKRAEAWKLWSSGQPQKAIPLFRELIKSDPQDANTHNGLGWSLLNTGQAKEAHEMFLQCLKLDPKHAAALNGVGQSALALHEWATAEEYLQKASDSFLAQVPETQLNAQNIPAAWFGLARVHLVQGNFDKATQWAERILKYDSNNADVKQMLDQAKKKDNTEIKKLLGL